jgi:transposase
LREAIAPHLPEHPPDPNGGRPRVADRQALAGILFVLREGLRWRKYLTMGPA